jgi:hypothetical protein
MVKGRIIVIGDIHGCADEFEELLALLAPKPEDQLFLLGDLVNRGPDSHRVIETARSRGAKSLLGNHELRLLNWRKTGDKRALKAEDHDTIPQLTPEDWTYLEQMAVTHYLPELDVVLVHGGFLPNQSWQTQPAEVVTRIQVVDKDNQPRKRSESPRSPLWAELWRGPPFVVYGHTPREEVDRRRWSIGIDTACYQGGRLTAYILPEQRILQVRARRKYA